MTASTTWSETGRAVESWAASGATANASSAMASFMSASSMRCSRVVRLCDGSVPGIRYDRRRGEGAGCVRRDSNPRPSAPEKHASGVSQREPLAENMRPQPVFGGLGRSPLRAGRRPLSGTRSEADLGAQKERLLVVLPLDVEFAAGLADEEPERRVIDVEHLRLDLDL